MKEMRGTFPRAPIDRMPAKVREIQQEWLLESDPDWDDFADTGTRWPVDVLLERGWNISLINQHLCGGGPECPEEGHEVGSLSGWNWCPSWRRGFDPDHIMRLERTNHAVIEAITEFTGFLASLTHAPRPRDSVNVYVRLDETGRELMETIASHCHKFPSEAEVRNLQANLDRKSTWLDFFGNFHRSPRPGDLDVYTDFTAAGFPPLLIGELLGIQSVTPTPGSLR